MCRSNLSAAKIMIYSFLHLCNHPDEKWIMHIQNLEKWFKWVNGHRHGEKGRDLWPVL
jgi:hypothetical protein